MLAAFGVGGLAVLALFAPTRQVGEAGTGDRPIASQVRWGNATRSNNLARSPQIRSAHERAALPAADAPPAEISPSTAIAREPAVPVGRSADPAPVVRPETAMASVLAAPSIPEGTQIEATPPTRAKSTVRTAKRATSQRHASKKSRRHDGPVEAYARYDDYYSGSRRYGANYGFWGDRSYGSRRGWYSGYN
jgi:hypothetical protein